MLKRSSVQRGLFDVQDLVAWADDLHDVSPYLNANHRVLALLVGLGLVFSPVCRTGKDELQAGGWFSISGYLALHARSQRLRPRRWCVQHKGRDKQRRKTFDSFHRLDHASDSVSTTSLAAGTRMASHFIGIDREKPGELKPGFWL